MQHPDPVVEAPDSFEVFFHREYRNMVALAIAVSGSRAQGEDLAQEALLRAHRHWRDVSRYEKPGAWLRRVTINLALSAKTRVIKEATARNRWARQRTQVAEPPEHDHTLWEAVGRLHRWVAERVESRQARPCPSLHHRQKSRGLGESLPFVRLPGDFLGSPNLD